VGSVALRVGGAQASAGNDGIFPRPGSPPQVNIAQKYFNIAQTAGPLQRPVGTMHPGETHQRDVIEKILRHCGLWEGPLRTPANPRAPPKRGTRPDGAEPRELQLVLDPEFL